MKVYLNEINGLWASIDAMYFSKRSWTREKEVYLKDIYARNYDRWGFAVGEIDDEMKELLDMLFRWSKSHITLGRFLDFTFTIEGLHRGAQDDFDSHAKRLENRILRSSTRLADFNDEKSDWYKDKILTMDEAIEILEMELPGSIVKNGNVYVKSTNGYVLEKFKNNKDVKRGLYILAIPSNFIFKCNCTEFAHVVKERDENSHAHPELREMIENCKGDLSNEIPNLTDEFYRSVKN